MDNMELLAIQEEDQNSLEHYGVKGQKWGQRNYQNPDGTYTELGKERRRVAFIKEEKAKKESDANAHQNGIEESIDTDTKIGGKAYKDMTRKELRQAKKRARHNEALRREKREFNRDKKAAVESGDLSFISQNISKFTNDEIDEALYRYNKINNLKALERQNKKDSEYYANKALVWLDKTDKGIKSITNILNSFNDARKKSLEKQQIAKNLEKTDKELRKADLEYEYTKDPSLKPLSKKEQLELKNQEAKNATDDATAKMKQRDADWQGFAYNQKRADYDSMNTTDFNTKWGPGSGYGPIKGQHDSKKLGGWFSKKDKDKENKDYYKDFNYDSKEINRLTEKYLNKLKESNKDYFKVGSVRDDQWKKDLKKHDSDVIDKWVKDMKKKYMKERNMDSKAAEEKAEAYVDSWLNAYDDELLKEIQAMR